MSIFSVEKLNKSFGEVTLFSDVSFHVEAGNRVGLVGANGAGKTTLFRMLIGEESIDGGSVNCSAGCRLGYMQQHIPENEELTASQWMLMAFDRVQGVEEQLNAANEAVEAGRTDEETLNRQHVLREEWERLGGLTYRSRADAALSGLGFSEEQKHIPLASLSGGQRSKLSLARLLVCDANLLLLDEPTNHLDLPAIQWLEDYLCGYKGAFVVISHDRYFLDKVTTSTLELEHGRLNGYKGNYSAYLQYKQQNRAIAEHHYQQQQKEIRRLEETVTELRRWNKEKSIKRAESKQKVIDKLNQQLEKPEAELQTIRFRFGVEQPGPNEVLKATGLSVHFGERVLYRDVSFLLKKSERVFLVGGNGCGKTTLLRQVLGKQPGKGWIEPGPGVEPAYYDQTQQQLDHSKTVLDEVWDRYPQLTQTEIRKALASFLFKGDDVLKTVGDCSGGERARIALLKTMLAGRNLLVLDEPTNHLDIGSREALEDALLDYDGTLLMVSHDRYLIQKLATRVWLLTPDGIREYPGGGDEWLTALRQKPMEESHPAEKSSGFEYKERKARDAQLRKCKTAIERTEREIAALEGQAEELSRQIADPAIASDYQKIMELNQRLQEINDEIDQKTERWAQLQEQFEQAELADQ